MSEHCFHCGVETDPEWRFCRKCGSSLDLTPVATRESFCTGCGADLATSWRYCVRCGTETPVAKQSRSVRLTADEMAAITEPAASAAAGGGTAVTQPPAEAAEAVEPPPVELISRKWDVIDLRPVEEELPAPPVAETPPPAPVSAKPDPVRVAAAPSPPRLAGEARLDLYRDPVTLGQLAQLAFLATGLVAVATVVGLIILNNRLEEFAINGIGGFNRVETVQNVVDGTLRPLLFILLLGAIGLLIAWTYRVHGNLVAFGKHDLRAPIQAGIWGWFVPVLNLVLPKQLLDDAWRGSDVYAAFDPDWKQRSGNPWLLVFWFSLLTGVVFGVVGVLIGSETVEVAMDANAWTMLGYIAVIAGCVSAVRLISAITDRQETRYRGLRGLI